MPALTRRSVPFILLFFALVAYATDHRDVQSSPATRTVQDQQPTSMVYGENSALAEAGTFEATLGGDREARLSGGALLYTLEAEVGTMHSVALYACPDDVSCQVIQFTRMHDAVPVEGRYVLDDVDEDGDVQAIYYEINSGEFTRFCGGVEGVLEVTRSKGDHLEGTFRLVAIDMRERMQDVEHPFRVEVEGSFEAPLGDATQLPAALQAVGQ